MPIPALTNMLGFDEKVLPLGTHLATPPEIGAFFVAGFGSSVTRSDVFDGWKRFRAFIRGIIPGIEKEFVNGSFVTERADPNDIDLSLWVHADVLDALPADTQSFLISLFEPKSGRAYLKQEFRCDPYLVAFCDVGHPRYLEFVHMKRINELWAKYKDPNGLFRGYKGFVEVVEP